MGTTPKGYPYPEDTDLLAQGAQAIKALANAVDTSAGRIATGTASLALPTANTVASVAVTFPVGRFTAAPSVHVNRTTGVSSASLPLYYYCAPSTTTGTNIGGISAATGGAAALQWTAVQAP